MSSISFRSICCTARWRCRWALLWGFGGILSFGQAAFFALGAYAMGLVQHWDMAVNPAYIALLISIAVGGALAGVVGYFLFSAGVRDVYFVLVTLALSIMTEQITISQSDITGGYNGMFIPRMSLSFAAPPWTSRTMCQCIIRYCH